MRCWGVDEKDAGVSYKWQEVADVELVSNVNKMVRTTLSADESVRHNPEVRTGKGRGKDTRKGCIQSERERGIRLEGERETIGDVFT